MVARKGLDWESLKWTVGCRKNHRWEVLELLDNALGTVTKHQLTSPVAERAFLSSV